MLHLPFAREAAGAAGTRHSLRPLFIEGHYLAKLGLIAPRDGGRVILQGCLKIESEIIIGAAASLAPIVSQPINPSLRANGSRECAPDDRLREAIHLAVRRNESWIASSRRASQ